MYATTWWLTKTKKKMNEIKETKFWTKCIRASTKKLDQKLQEQKHSHTKICKASNAQYNQLFFCMLMWLVMHYYFAIVLTHMGIQQKFYS